MYWEPRGYRIGERVRVARISPECRCFRSRLQRMDGGGPAVVGLAGRIEARDIRVAHSLYVRLDEPMWNGQAVAWVAPAEVEPCD